MSKFIITTNNKKTNKQVIIINGDNSCELIDEKLVIYNAIKLKPFISINTTILIEFENNLYLLPDFILMFMKNDTVDSNLTVSYLNFCSYKDFMDKVNDNNIDLNDFNSLFKEEESYDESDSEFNSNVCYCSIM